MCDTSYHEGPTRGDRCAGTMGVRYTARARGGALRESRESETYPYPQSRGYGGPLVSCVLTPVSSPHVFHVRLACDLGVCRRRRTLHISRRISERYKHVIYAYIREGTIVKPSTCNQTAKVGALSYTDYSLHRTATCCSVRSVVSLRFFIYQPRSSGSRSPLWSVSCYANDARRPQSAAIARSKREGVR